MLKRLIQRYRTISADLHASKLYDENTFYKAFLKDLAACRSEVIIESPFVTTRRLAEVMPILRKLKNKGVRVVVITKDPRDHDKDYSRDTALDALATLQGFGVHVIYVQGHHRKLAVLDRGIVYEGSLNILSQNNSREIMRRIKSEAVTMQAVNFIGIGGLL